MGVLSNSLGATLGIVCIAIGGIMESLWLILLSALVILWCIHSLSKM